MTPMSQVHPGLCEYDSHAFPHCPTSWQARDEATRLRQEAGGRGGGGGGGGSSHDVIPMDALGEPYQRLAQVCVWVGGGREAIPAPRTGVCMWGGVNRGATTAPCAGVGCDGCGSRSGSTTGTEDRALGSALVGGAGVHHVVVFSDWTAAFPLLIPLRPPGPTPPPPLRTAAWARP